MRKNRIRSTSSSISSQNSKFRKKFVPPRKLSAPLKPISNATSSNETKKTFKPPTKTFKPPTKTSYKPPTKNSFKPPTKTSFKPPTKTFKPPNRSTGFAAPAFVSKPVDVSEKQTAKRYLYEVMFCKRSNKKRKTYDDGLLIISSKKKAYLKDMSGKDIAYSQAKFETMEEGETFLFGGWEAEVVKGVTEEEYTSGRFFIQNTVSVTVKRPVLPKMKKTVLPKGIRKSTTSLQQPRKKKLKQTFDPDRGKWFEKSGSRICLDRFLERRMRPHQIEGARFLWECLSGNREYVGSGALLCDEMGLGMMCSHLYTSPMMFS